MRLQGESAEPPASRAPGGGGAWPGVAGLGWASHEGSPREPARTQPAPPLPWPRPQSPSPRAAPPQLRGFGFSRCPSCWLPPTPQRWPAGPRQEASTPCAAQEWPALAASQRALPPPSPCCSLAPGVLRGPRYRPPPLCGRQRPGCLGRDGTLVCGPSPRVEGCRPESHPCTLHVHVRCLPQTLTRAPTVGKARPEGGRTRSQMVPLGAALLGLLIPQAPPPRLGALRPEPEGAHGGRVPAGGRAPSDGLCRQGASGQTTHDGTTRQKFSPEANAGDKAVRPAGAAELGARSWTPSAQKPARRPP